MYREPFHSRCSSEKKKHVKNMVLVGHRSEKGIFRTGVKRAGAWELLAPYLSSRQTLILDVANSLGDCSSHLG